MYTFVTKPNEILVGNLKIFMRSEALLIGPSSDGLENFCVTNPSYFTVKNKVCD